MPKTKDSHQKNGNILVPHFLGSMLEIFREKSLSKKLPAPSSVKGCDRPGLPRVASTFRGNQFGRENPGALLVGRSWHHLR